MIKSGIGLLAVVIGIFSNVPAQAADVLCMRESFRDNSLAGIALHGILNAIPDELKTAPGSEFPAYYMESPYESLFSIDTFFEVSNSGLLMKSVGLSFYAKTTTGNKYTFSEKESAILWNAFVNLPHGSGRGIKLHYQDGYSPQWQSFEINCGTRSDGVPACVATLEGRSCL